MLWYCQLQQKSFVFTVPDRKADIKRREGEQVYDVNGRRVVVDTRHDIVDDDNDVWGARPTPRARSFTSNFAHFNQRKLSVSTS